MPGGGRTARRRRISSWMSWSWSWPRPGVRRLLLKRSHYHLYFVEQADRVFVVAVWSTYRGPGPRL
jgi:hypothetical protein